MMAVAVDSGIHCVQIHKDGFDIIPEIAVLFGIYLDLCSGVSFIKIHAFIQHL